MMKFSTRYGDMFSWGWLPPVAVIHAGFMAAFPVAAYGFVVFVAQIFPDGPGALGDPGEPIAVWLWAGISEIFSVWVASPPSSPRAIPLPTCTGERPCRFGSPKVCLPSPPYVVPKIENNAWFWLIGKSCPLQNVQPLGGKFQLMIFISAINGSDIFQSPLGGRCLPCVLISSRRQLYLGREYPEQRNNEVDH